MLGGRFGASSAEIVIEEFLEGEEASLFALCDGTTALCLGTAQDHKRAFDGDEGPNTGGMGAFSPAVVLDDAMVEEAMARIVKPTLAALAARGSPFRGFLYAGLMLTRDGPKLIEYNCRFGDPECQVVMPRLMTDLVTAMLASRDGVLGKFTVRFSPRKCVGVVLATQRLSGRIRARRRDLRHRGSRAARRGHRLPGRDKARRRAPSRRWRARDHGRWRRRQFRRGASARLRGRRRDRLARRLSPPRHRRPSVARRSLAALNPRRTGRAPESAPHKPCG